MLTLWLSGCAGHVPTYDDANCVVPPHPHTTSQVVYHRTYPNTSAGLEIHCSASSCPFQWEAGEMLDVGATFLKKYDPSTFELRIGCLGCVDGVDPVEQQPPVTVEYGRALVEPFTQAFLRVCNQTATTRCDAHTCSQHTRLGLVRQTRYVSGLSEADTRYNSAGVAPNGTCSQAHFAIRLSAHLNASVDGIVWGAVIGKGEQFTAEELLSFPLYILLNHGNAWTGLPWTLPVVTVSVIALDLVSGVPYLFTERRRFVPTILQGPIDLRALLLQGALWSFAVAATEIGLHLLLAQIGSEFDASFWIGLILVIGIAQLLPLALVVTVWRAKDRGDGCTNSVWWAPVQLGAAVGGFFLLGAGFWVGPRCSTLIPGTLPARAARTTLGPNSPPCLHPHSLLAADALVRAVGAIDRDVVITEKGEERLELREPREL